MLSLALPRPISLSAMSVIAVFAFWAATRRGRAAMTGRYGAGSRTINRGSWVWGRVVVDGSLIMEGPNSSKGGENEVVRTRYHSRQESPVGDTNALQADPRC